MELKHVFINQYRGIRNLSLNFGIPKSNADLFGDLKISVLVGENGTGKTSIFKLLTLALCPQLNVAEENYSCRIHYTINNQDYKFENGIPESMGINEYPNKVIVSSFSVFDQFVPPRKVNRDSKIEDGSRYVYGGPLNGINSSSLTTVIQILLETFYKTKKNNEQYNAYRKMLEVIGYGDIQYLEFSLNSDNYGIGSRYQDKLLENEEYHVEYNNRKKLREKTRRIRIKKSNFPHRAGYIVAIDDIDECLFELMLDVIAQGFCPIRDVWIRKDNSVVPLSRMSSGELTMLFRFFPLISEITHNSLVLIDEPETHLHPKWVQRYIYHLVKIFSSFKAHIILATHSPLITADVPVECIVGLMRDSHNIISQYPIPEKTLGGNPEDIMKAVFGLNQINSEFTNGIMEKISQLLGEQKRDTALELYSNLSNTTEKYNLFLKIRDKLE
ncbi:AAA family ATPase [Pelosinus sp. UFO1]|uniref:AAA family ATPase n=1 Tax=Pelosinus sp. UFO1 TaxID=484770 RepID=UPI0004D0EE43|nr:ATP-binding protein [Pelosinus sp. UFO1]AIF50222.1 hypothetical protein UFO1_0667 [Pelosinus sp. UFO1]